jgi:DNA-binding response OmpR family regulator
MARILLIEDDDQLRHVIAQSLAAGGHEAFQAADGRQGLDIFRAGTFDLVLTDLVMPEKEGVETIIELRRENPTLKIVAMSGGMPRSNFYLGLATHLGAQRTLAKPFTPTELLNAIDETLAAPATPPPPEPKK